MIVIVDSGIANVRSVANMFRRIGLDADISADPKRLILADKLVLPGVGAFDAGMRALRSRGMLDALEQARAREVPVLGICLGMQLLGTHSSEGSEPGLGWLDASCEKFDFRHAEGLRVPHMGWNTLESTGRSSLIDSLPADSRFYFVHSFRMACADEADIAATTFYGQPFVSAVHRGNIMGVQFHPEKSHRFGMALLQQFASL